MSWTKSSLLGMQQFHSFFTYFFTNFLWNVSHTKGHVSHFCLKSLDQNMSRQKGMKYSWRYDTLDAPREYQGIWLNSFKIKHPGNGTRFLHFIPKKREIRLQRMCFPFQNATVQINWCMGSSRVGQIWTDQLYAIWQVCPVCPACDESLPPIYLYSQQSFNFPSNYWKIGPLLIETTTMNRQTEPILKPRLLRLAVTTVEICIKS